MDRFRIKIWKKVTNTVVYDNHLGNDDEADEADDGDAAPAQQLDRKKDM